MLLVPSRPAQDRGLTRKEMVTYLFRVLEIDDEGDPLDFGVMRATDIEDAVREVTKRLRSVLESGCWSVRFYPVVEVPHGLFEDAGDFADREIVIEQDGEERE